MWLNRLQTALPCNQHKSQHRCCSYLHPGTCELWSWQPSFPLHLSWEDRSGIDYFAMLLVASIQLTLGNSLPVINGRIGSEIDASGAHWDSSSILGLQSYPSWYAILLRMTFPPACQSYPELSSCFLGCVNEVGPAALVRTASSSVDPSLRGMWICQIKVKGGPWRCSEGWSTSGVRQGWASWDCLAHRRKGSRKTLLCPFCA